MAEIKPNISEAEARALLQVHFDAPVTTLAPLGGGRVARAFTFSVGGEAQAGKPQIYVLRFNAPTLGDSFAKEAYVQTRYASARVPIPPILHLGEYRDLTYAISRKVPGETLDALPAEQLAQALPQVIATLDAIHHINVSEQTHYGLFNSQGIGLFPGWRDYLAYVCEEEESGGFYGRWHHLFSESFLERDVFDYVYTQMTLLLDFCPEARYLVHGGYGYGNVLVDEEQVSAVLDWSDAKYGDFVYDIAWFSFWPGAHDIQAEVRRYYAARGITIPFYAERVRCYKCYIALDGLRFFAQAGDYRAYRASRQVILDLLAQPLEDTEFTRLGNGYQLLAPA